MSRYPFTRRDDLVETLHGVDVADPYRWLEDADAPEVARWVAAQRDHAEAALAELPERAWFAEVLRRVVGRPRAGIPLERGGRWLLGRNDGTQAQDVWWVADSLAELRDGGRIVLDPNAWSADGTDSLSTFGVSRDGRYLAYAVSRGGSDWQHIRIKDLTTGVDLDAPELVAKFSTPEWLPDHRSLLYATYDEASDARGTATAGLGAGRLMLHRLGEDTDEVVLQFADDPHLMGFGEVTHDGRWLLVTIVRGTERKTRLWAYPLTTASGRTTIGAPIKVIDDATAEFEPIRVAGSQLLLLTDLDAPRGRVVRVDLDWAAHGDVEFAEVIPEGVHPLLSVVAAGDTLLVARLDDATPTVAVHDIEGTWLVDLDLPAGALVGLDASPARRWASLGISTLDAPTSAFGVDVSRAVADAVAPVERLELAGVSERIAPEFTVTRRRASSADGTQVPYFLVEPANADAAGPRPTLLYGYGGFKIPVLADYRPGWSAWLAAGGVLALANLRGGGEYGSAWYDAGRGVHKQHVFDDAVAVAEHLVETGTTTPGQLAVHGRSNGGLLVGALMTQRPELFAAALPTVGVLDLLRFHRFTIGAAWISDYGDPDVAEDFAVAHAYSPLHRVADGVAYPPTLVCTADHDDRVVPLHSFKFAAALQHAQSGDARAETERPVLLRIESAAGHGAGKSQAMLASEWADVLAFAAHHTGLRPPD